GRGDNAGAAGRFGKSEPRSARATGRRNAAQRRAELAPLRNRIVNADSAITRLTEEIARIDRKLSIPDLFANDPGGAAELTTTRSAAVQALATAEEEWLEASSAYDAALV